MDIKKEIKSAIDGKRLSVIDAFDLRSDIKPILKEAVDNMGINISPAKADDMLYRLSDYCKYYSYLTFEDLVNILRFGSLGVYGENYRFNMQIITKWFTSYLNDRLAIVYDLGKTDACTTEERLLFLWNNRDKIPFWNEQCKKPRHKGRQGLRRINEI